MKQFANFGEAMNKIICILLIMVKISLSVIVYIYYDLAKRCAFFLSFVIISEATVTAKIAEDKRRNKNNTSPKLKSK